MDMLVLFLTLITFQSSTSLVPCTSNYCPPIPEKGKITTDKEIPMKDVGDVEHGCHCRENPNVYTLCFNFKDKDIPCLGFPRNVKVVTAVLILKSTFITEIVRGDFINLDNVEVMTLDGNQKLLYIQPFVFENMTKLTTLSFIFNPLLLSLHPDTFQGLVNLKELHLVKNGLHSIKQLSVTLKANILPKLYKLNLNENIFKNISEFDFHPMEGSSLVELNMILCGIEHIHPRALKPLKELAALRVGENRIDFDFLIDMLRETLDMGINLQLLDLYSSGFRTYKHRSLLEIVAKSNISTLILARNQFDILDNESFPLLMPSLISLDLSDVSAQSINNQAFTNLPNLRTLILAKNKLSFFGASEQLPNLTYLDLQENTDVYGWEFFLTRSEFKRMKLEYLSLENTRLILLTKTDFGYIPELRILNLKKCNILKIEDDTLSGLVNLKTLNLEDNRFFRVWVIFYFEIFRGLGNLEELFLGGNDITTLTTSNGYLLEHLKNLRHLGLRKNSLQRISHRDFANFNKLELLDLSENYLLSWDSRVFMKNNLHKLYLSVNKIGYLSVAMLKDFHNLTHIEINYNSFICDCKVKNQMSSDKNDLKKFLNLTKDSKIYCVSPKDITLSNFTKSIINSSLDCRQKFNILVVIIPLVIILVIIVTIGVLGYIYRWHIRYWAFLVRLYLTRKGKIRTSAKTGYTNYQYDAFVSYCNQDRYFVMRLMRMLENHEPCLKLCVYERDFQVGSIISESVLEHIAKSRKTLLIVSNSYAKSYWCNWESQIAEHHRLFFENPNGDCVDESIVVIKLGPISDVHLNPTLKYLLKTRIYLQWDSDDDKQKVFWQKLRQFLTPPKSELVESTNL